MKRILVIEPYYGGSHKRFLDGLMGAVEADFTLMSLPARKWKMRMQLSAPWFARQVESLAAGKRAFDTVLFSSFIDVAVFRAMSQSIDGWNPRCRYCTYFHENQFVYPGYLNNRANHQFTAINFTSALTSDTIAFNSQFNRSTFIDQCRRYLAKAADMDLSLCAALLEENSRVLYPGIDFTPIDRFRRERRNHVPPRIVWNHRWEHDKDPRTFFETLYRLADERLDFELLILGQRFRNRPACFAEARERLKGRIIHFGFVEDQEAYHRWLLEGDIVVSTALHEFFGISVIEAVRAGCLPMLPERLVYPELFDKHYLYPAGDLYGRLRAVLKEFHRLPAEDALRLTDPYDWRNLASSYAEWLGI